LSENSINLHVYIFLLYNRYIKNSNDFNKVTAHIIHDLIYLSHGYMGKVWRWSNYEHVYYHFVQMVLDGEMIKIKVVDIDDFYIFVVCDFFIWNHLFSKNYVWSSHIL
jgi:hypothetical protein